jgi:preprotein translocase subunit Sss1
MLQAGGRAWVLGAIGFAAGVLLILSEFLAVRYVKTITASCSDFADAELRDNCLTVGHESHYWGFALLGLFVILMTYGVAAGGSRPAALALLVAGVVGLAITLIHDLPDTTRKGEVGVAFAEAEAHKGTGFWFELVGSSLALGCGLFAVWRTPPPRAERERPRPAAAGDAEEPSTA